MTATHPAFELHIALKVAARTAMQYAATDEQIRTIVALARGSNNYNLMLDGRLTRVDAKHLIDYLIKNGAEPEFRKFPEEIVAEQELRERAARNAGIKKIFKSQAKEEKAKREEAKAEADRKIAGRRVTHTKFGEGTVIAEDDRSVTVMFDSQKKAMRVALAFVS